jgi:hypothetical protein
MRWKKMKKLILTLSILAVLLFSACVPVATKYVCSDGSQVDDSSQCPVTTVKIIPKEDTAPVAPETPPTPPEDEPVVLVKDLSEEAKALFDKTSKVTNVRFNYFSSADPYPKDKYTATRERMKLLLVAKVRYTAADSYDTVYLDFEKKEAVAYCEEASTGVCVDPNKKFAVSYERYKIRTPFQWLDLVESADVTGRSKQISGRQAKEVSFKAEGKSGIMWLDSFFGVPLEIEYDGVKIEFQNMLINDAKDSELYHVDVSVK